MLKQALVLAALLLPGAFANAHEYTVGDLHIAHPWSLELPPNAPTSRPTSLFTTTASRTTACSRSTAPSPTTPSCTSTPRPLTA